MSELITHFNFKNSYEVEETRYDETMAPTHFRCTWTWQLQVFHTQKLVISYLNLETHSFRQQEIYT